MLPEKILQSDLLDILFENRNKTYGAYALRRSYNKKLITSTAITFFIALPFSIFQFMHSANQSSFIKKTIFLPDQELIDIQIPEKPVTPAPQKPVASHFNQEIYSPPVIANDNNETETPTIDELNSSIIGDKNIIGDKDPGTILPPAVSQEMGIAAATPPAVIEESHPLSRAQEMPEYPGGIEALKKFMLRNLHQPDDLRPGQKIVVKAFFVVSKDGKIEQVKIISQGRDDLDKEVTRVINKMPLWKPGRQNGNAVAVYFNLPVTFVNTEEE